MIPKIRPESQADKSHGRWGDSYRDNWQQDEASSRFKSIDDMLRFSPLEQGDFTGWNVVVDGDFSSEDIIYERYRKNYPAEWGDKAPEGSSALTSFYNTMFMWPMLVFGYENFMMLCLEPEFERIMDEFAEINRRVFRAIARRYENCLIAGEGDNRVLNRNTPAEIRKMVESMVETGRMSRGYMMSIGNHIPFNTPPEAVKLYLDLSAELAYRD